VLLTLSCRPSIYNQEKAKGQVMKINRNLV
jgi:hypothetical protein